MSFYEPQGWQAPQRQPSWEQPPPPSRSGASSTSQREEPSAFILQFEEVDRAIDNLVKSGKFYPQMPRQQQPPVYGGGNAHGGGRSHGGRHSVGDFRPSSRSNANVQNFYAQQRFQGRPSEPDQMMQAKRRMAAQRERELRNYHQEQQYNRKMASNKSDRSMSPSTLSEEGRRDLIARQHRALYGSEAAGYSGQGAFGPEGGADQSGPGPVAPTAGMRGPSPRGMDPFGMNQQGDASQQTSAEAKATSPTSHQQGKAPTPPTTAEEGSHSRSISKSTTAPIAGPMGPIGSRPNAQHGPAQSLNKRTTSPLPSSLGYGFPPNDNNEKPVITPTGQKETTQSPMGPWGPGSGVWGPNKIGASVWS